MLRTNTVVTLTEDNPRYRELLEAQAELGKLPADIGTIIEVEQMGFCVDLVTGDLRPDTDRFALTLIGEAMAVVVATGFCNEEEQP